jgi:predicted nuclease of restriction endonuclease-like (RecB) superfamily
MYIRQTYGDELFDNVKHLLTEARKAVVKNVNKVMVYTYYEIGRMIVEEEQKGEQRAEYGEKIIKELSHRLTAEFGKGFSKRNVEQMRQFYLVYSDNRLLPEAHTPIAQTLSAQLQMSDNNYIELVLGWSHYVKLMRIDNPEERRFYKIESFKNNWSLRELQRQFDTALYERLALSKDKEGVKSLAQKGQIIEKPQDVLKDPYVPEFIGLSENTRYSESELEQKLIDKLEHFMLELGKGFTFAGRQVRFTFDDQHFRVDLAFYNRLLQCFVLIDLKIGKLTHQDIGQMQMYVNYYDRYVKLEHETKTIGIILCKEKSDTLVRITLPEDNEQIFAGRYQTVLPSKEDLKRLMESK